MAEEANHVHLSTNEIVTFAVLAVVLTVFGGIMSALNLGLFSLDKRELEARSRIETSSSSNEVNMRTLPVGL